MKDRKLPAVVEPQIVYERGSKVKKAASVVMARARGELVKADHMLFNYLLNRAYYKIQEAYHRIPVRDAMNFLGPGATVATVNESLKRMGEVHIEIDYEEMTGEKRHRSMHFLSYDTCRAESGILTFAFDPLLVPFLAEPKVYALLSLTDVRKFKTLAGERLYEKMLLHNGRTYDKTWTVPIDELYQLWGISPDMRPDNFRTRIVAPAVDEVCEHAPFNLQVTYDKEGRGGKINLARFTVVEKTHQDMMSPVRKARPAKLPKDRRAIDLFDGKTIEERGSTIVVTPEAYEQAEKMIEGKGIDLGVIEQEWREKVTGLKLKDTDQNFLDFVAVCSVKSEDKLLSKIDSEFLDDLLG